MKLLKESTGNYFHDFGVGKRFLELRKHNLLKKKLINWTSSKLKMSAHQNILLGKENTNYKLSMNLY